MIDETTYNRTREHKVRDGYQARGNARPSSIIIHTTNNKRIGTTFSGEAAFLCNSPNVSAHYIVGKEGQTALIVPPQYQAWQAGPCKPEWQNARSIGIEMHVSVGERPTGPQIAALTELVQGLMRRYAIPAQMIETHRAVALPPRRKSDPEGWDDGAFYGWRLRLSASDTEWLHVLADCPIVQEARPDAPLACTTHDGRPTAESYARGTLAFDGRKNGMVHLASGAGWIMAACVEPV